MEEETGKDAEAPERSASEPIKFDFRRRREEPFRERPRRHPLVWAGLIAALLLMFAGTAVVTLARKHWGMYLFAAAAILYLVCRCVSIGLLNTMPKLLTLLLMLAGCLLVGVFPIPSVMGILGVACLAAAFVLLVLFGLVYARR